MSDETALRSPAAGSEDAGTPNSQDLASSLDALLIEHEALIHEHQALLFRPFQLLEHQNYLSKLHAHRARIRAFNAGLHAASAAAIQLPARLTPDINALMRSLRRVLSYLQKLADKRATAAGASIEEALRTLEWQSMRIEGLDAQVVASETQVLAERARFGEFLNLLTEAVLITRVNSEFTIIDANRRAAELMNVSAKHLRGRALTRFFAENRDELATTIRSGVSQPWSGSVAVRPRERRSRIVPARVQSLPPRDGEDDCLYWFFDAPAQNS